MGVEDLSVKANGFGQAAVPVIGAGLFIEQILVRVGFDGRLRRLACVGFSNGFAW
jgi:hypothetical protein